MFFLDGEKIYEAYEIYKLIDTGSKQYWDFVAFDIDEIQYYKIYKINEISHLLIDITNQESIISDINLNINSDDTLVSIAGDKIC
jgi:hypothetical protein